MDSIIEETNKENNDEFPYYLINKENFKLHYCMKYSRHLHYFTIVLFILLGIISLIDLSYIAKTQDFSNSMRKVDDLFLALRIISNSANFFAALCCLKVIIFNKDKYHLLFRFEKYMIFLNIFIVFLLISFHIRVHHLTYHNENYYSLRLLQVLTIIIYATALYCLKPFVYTEVQQSRKVFKISKPFKPKRASIDSNNSQVLLNIE